MSQETPQPREVIIKQLMSEAGALEKRKLELQRELDVTSKRFGEVDAQLKELQQQEWPAQRETAGTQELFSGFEWENQKDGIQVKKFEQANGQIIARLWSTSDSTDDWFLSFEITQGTFAQEIWGTRSFFDITNKDADRVQICKKRSVLRFPKTAIQNIIGQEGALQRDNPFHGGLDVKKFLIERGELLLK